MRMVWLVWIVESEREGCSISLYDMLLGLGLFDLFVDTIAGVSVGVSVGVDDGVDAASR